jgi:hypothetical protein
MPDFYAKVPKDLEANLAYRIELRRKAQASPRFQAALLKASREDVLFWINAFCWAYEPRPRIVDGVKMPHTIPFITWSHQDPVILEIKKHLGFEDIGAEKSRGEGASWIASLLALHDWTFEPLTAIGLVSRNEAAVDNPEDPDSLFWKIDWELTQLPFWMRPPFKRRLDQHTLRNLSNGSTITGYAATGDVASGGRKKWFLMDELAKFDRGPDAEAMASTQYVTNSRLVVSTPKGSEGAYYDLMHQPSSMVKVVLDWKDNITRNRGLYTLQNSIPVAIDPVNNPLPKGYATESVEILSRLRNKGFKLDGSVRSPWYDHECDRPGATPQNIAQELDRDYGGSMYRIFGNDFFDRTEDSVRKPFVAGMLDYSKETLEPSWDTIEAGPMHLWTTLDAQRRPPQHPYAIGADVSTGLGGSYTSNSVVTVIDMLTREQVLEYACNTMSVPDFADLCIALAKWFHGAYLSWEHNGPGAGFTARVKTQRYPNCYLRASYWRSGSKKRSKELGWWTDDKTKEKMFSELARAVKVRELVLRSEMLVTECGQYVRLGGKIEHIMAANTADESSRGKAHGDRVIAAGVCLQAVLDRPLSRPGGESSLGEPRPDTMAARQKAYEDSQDPGDGWDERSNWDLARAR